MHLPLHFTRLIGIGAFMLTTACSMAPAAPDPTTMPAVQEQAQGQAVQNPGMIVIPDTLPTNEAGEPLIIRVNGDGVLLSDYQRLMTRYEQQQFFATDTPAMQAAVLGTLVEQVLINQAAAEAGVVISDTQIETEIATNTEAAGGEEGWVVWLQENYYSADEYRRTIRDTLVTLQMRDRVLEPLNGDIEQVHARHILVNDEATALEVLSRLQGGEDFAALASEYSLDMTSNNNGGDLGWFTREELLEPTLSEVAFSIEPGTVIGPVETMLGYHVLQSLESGMRPIADDKRASLSQVFFDNWLQSLFADATIEYYIN